jgi:hypothetical protein
MIPPGSTPPHPDRRARIEITAAGVEVYAPYDADLRDALRALPGAYWTPGHWTVPDEHQHEAVELVGDVYATPTIVDTRAAR